MRQCFVDMYNLFAVYKLNYSAVSVFIADKKVDVDTLFRPYSQLRFAVNNLIDAVMIIELVLQPLLSVTVSSYVPGVRAVRDELLLPLSHW